MATRSKFHGLTWSKKDLTALRKVGHPLVISKIPHTIIGFDMAAPGGDESAIARRTGDRIDVITYRELLTQAKRNVGKYRNQRIKIDGVTYDSKKEVKAMADLSWRQHLGEITDLKYHQRYRLEVRGVHVCDYEADFTFREHVPPVRFRVVDCKGYKRGAAWVMFQIKRKLMLACHGIEVEVI